MSATALNGAPISRSDTGNERGLLRRMFSTEPWIAAAFMILSFVLGVFWFCSLVTLISTGGSLLIVIIGAPILIATMYAWIAGARIERWRVQTFFGLTIRDPYRPVPTDESMLRRVRAQLGDSAVWKDLAFLILLFPLGLLEFVLTVALVATTFSSLLTPAFYWVLPEEAIDYGQNRSIDTFPEALLVGAGGVLLFFITTAVLIGLKSLHIEIAKAMLGHNREQELEDRVSTLTESRSRVMDAVADERRRIERDLHDGAQQRLVALAMDLGMAKEKMASDPAAARALVDEAHDHAKQALSEMRELVRGIHPAVLTDRGLDAAISALAGRSPVPVSVEVDLPHRLPDAIETNAYFMVAEALANVAKHSQATRARVIVRCDGSGENHATLVIEVADDGIGGVDPAKGSGLTGLRDRLAALDGKLLISSPPGGPSWIRAELPCLPLP